MRAFAAGVVALSVFGAQAGCAPAAPAHPGVTFKSDDVGRCPTGFTPALTGGGDVPPAWVVRADPVAPGGGPVLVQESADETSYRFPLCVWDAVAAADVSASVRFRTLAGTVDQAGGLVVRYRPENYYVARANALEDNVNLFKTVAGNRIKLAEVPAKVEPGRWHALGFAARGRHLTVTFDGKPVIEADDDTFAGPGRVGLWTKADSVTAFADLRVEPGPR